MGIGFPGFSENGVDYIAMEFIDGKTLDQYEPEAQLIVHPAIVVPKSLNTTPLKDRVGEISHLSFGMIFCIIAVSSVILPRYGDLGNVGFGRIVAHPENGCPDRGLGARACTTQTIPVDVSPRHRQKALPDPRALASRAVAFRALAACRGRTH